MVKPLKWLILAISISFIYHFKQNGLFNVYLCLKWLEIIVAYGTFAILFKDYSLKSLFLRAFVWLCAFQSIISLIQFYKQTSLGLYRLGESHLSPTIYGVAKIVSGETPYIRGYGTFPHPNPFSAFLIMGVFIGTYLYTQSSTWKPKVLYTFLTSLSILGLTSTFSRGAYIGLGVGLALFLGYALWKKLPNIKTLLATIFLSLLLSFIIFKPFLLTRATFKDQSTADRKFYNSMGIKMAIQNPIFGTGIGEGLLHMEQYSGKNLDPWEKQPPHNYFIVSAAELGLPVMLLLLWFFLSHLCRLVARIWNQESSEDKPLTTYYLLLTTLLVCFLTLMQFDHYFYTLQQTQFFLWIFLALVSSETKNSPEKGSIQLLETST